MGWQARVLPYLEQQPLWGIAMTEYQRNPVQFLPPYHTADSTILPILLCPEDGRFFTVHTYMNRPVSLSSYPGVEGTDYGAKDGMLFNNSRVRQIDVRDGTSNTLLIGERPPTFNFRFGWWYAGNGQNGTGSCDMVLGVRELAVSKYGCPRGPYRFTPTFIGAPCAQFFFWSLHEGGANFAFADGSVHFLTYQADTLLPALSTRAGGEVASLSN